MSTWTHIRVQSGARMHVWRDYTLGEPRVMLQIDEVTMKLDPDAVEQLLQMLQALLNENATAGTVAR